MRANKFERMEQLKTKADRVNLNKSAILNKLRQTLPGFTDEELALLFPHLSGVLLKNKPKDGK